MLAKAIIDAADEAGNDGVPNDGGGLSAWERVKAGAGQNNKQSNLQLMTVLASEVESREIPWVWKDYLARGMFTLIGGMPGLSKSTVAFLMAAIISRGGKWPDGTKAKAGKVVLWSGEDPKDTVLVPRLGGDGGNFANIIIIEGVFEKGRKVAFDPAVHAEALVQKINATDGVRPAP